MASYTQSPGGQAAVPQRTEADAIIEQMRRMQTHSKIDFDIDPNSTASPLLLLPRADGGVDVRNVLDEVTPPSRPFAHAGVTMLHDEGSFAQHVERFKQPETVLYLERALSTKTCVFVTAVYDHASPLTPSFERHRAQWTPRWSPEVRAWEEQAGQWMDQPTFAAFIEEHALDLTHGERHAHLTELAEMLATTIGQPRQMLALARTLSIKVSASVHEDVRTATGEGALTFVEQHEAREGSQAVTVPTLFAIAVPVLDGGPSFVIPVQLRYRIHEKRVRWRYTLYRFDQVLKFVQEDLVKRLSVATNLPVLSGTPREAID